MKLSDLYIKLGLRKDGFDKGIDGAKKKTNAFGNAVKKIGGMLAGAFAVNRITAFAKELMVLGGVAQGVEAAFNRIADAQVLRGLQEATKGTVSELELMKRTVMANNFQIPVENLASLFAFATKRAQETGESVDYLVNSIVLGIGRKSPLILDNLGISAVRLRQELKGAGVELNTVEAIAAAVGKIAAEEMGKSGDIIETNAIKIQNLTAEWENFKKSLATDPKISNVATGFLSEIKDAFFIITQFKTAKQVEELDSLRDKMEQMTESEFWVFLRGMTMTKTKAELKDIQKIWEEIQLSQGLTGPQGPQPFDFSGVEGFDFPQWEKELGYTDALRELLKDTKKELDTLMKTRGKFHGEESAEDFIKKVDELSGKINDLTEKLKFKDVPRVDMEELAPKGTSTGELEKFFPDWVSPDSSVLDNMDAFKAKINERLANLIDAETFDKMKENFVKLEEVSMELTAALESTLVSAFQGVGEAIGEALTGGSWQDFGKAILKIYANFMQVLGGAMIAIGVALLELELNLTAANAPGVIAAGIGLTIAGAALSSIVSGGIKGKGGGAYAGATSSTGGSSASTALSGDVRFVLEGDKLVGAINGSRQRRSITG